MKDVLTLHEGHSEAIVNKFTAIFSQPIHKCHTYVRRKYLLFCYRCELPIRYPEGYLSCVIDDMDQAKLESPFPRTNTKETSGLLKLNNHLIGSIVTLMEHSLMTK